MNQLADPQIASKITRLYLLALTVVALLSIGGQVLVQRSLNSQQSDAKVINIAGRQRMLSQKICKTVLLLQYQPDSTSKQIHIADLKADLTLWQQCHTGLSKGYLGNIDTRVNNSDTIRAMFKQIDPLFQGIFTHASLLYTYYQRPAVMATRPASSIQTILQNERAYLHLMNKIVFQYDSEATKRLEHTRHVEHILLFCTLMVLLMEVLLVFRPAVTQIRETVGLLLQSEENTQKANSELREANYSLAETREALLTATRQQHQREINEQKMRSAYLIEGQEEERKRVALEIHDGLGQMLTALKYGIEKMGDSVPHNKQAHQHLQEVQQLIGQVITEARTISFDLMPSVLSDFGLSSALKLLTSQTSTNAGLPVTLATNGSRQRLHKNIEIGLYRIAQEAIHNALKYAEAKKITVELWHKKKYIHLSITDNGVGFNYDDEASLPPKTSLAHGISNMKERTFILNGKINITSRPGEGTQIHVKIPLLPFLNEQN